MDTTELHGLLVRTMTQVSDLSHQVQTLSSRERRVETALAQIHRRVEEALRAFDRDRYKSTDQRLLIRALADEIQIFDRLGYDLAVPGARFLLGVSALLHGRHVWALECFTRFIDETSIDDPIAAQAHYLSAMVCYNLRDFTRAIQQFDAAYRLSAGSRRDWQSFIYVGELRHFLRAERDVIDKTFSDVESALDQVEARDRHFLETTLYLKWGNCYAQTTLLEPRVSNLLVNRQTAVAYYKRARRALSAHSDPDSLLPAVVDYSLALALLSSNTIDSDLPMTPSELLVDVFARLRRIVLTKREETILAQCYLMLGTCAVLSPRISSDTGEIYLEYARTQTLTVPSGICFFSCLTKELVSRDEFIQQVDHCTAALRCKARRR